jgi:endonuclease YncB( thermonuclease family)
VSDPNDNDVDQYGRQLRYVIVGDIFVNYTLIREGLAFLYSSPIQCGPFFFQAWEDARADKVGLYAPTAAP